jgi:hypothetical protein
VEGIQVKDGSDGGPVHLRLERTFRISGRVDLAPFGGQADRVWLSVTRSTPGSSSGESSIRAGAQVGAEGVFMLENLMPGSYTGQFYGNLGGDWVLDRPLELRAEDLTGVTLRPVKREQPPPKAQ